MRVSMPLTRRTRISLGPVGLLIVAPVVLAGWVLYAAVLLAYLLGRGVYLAGRAGAEGIAAALRWAEHWQPARR